MNIQIKNSLKWKKISLILLDDIRNKKLPIDLTFDNNITTIDVDLSANKYCYFTNGKTKTEMIILSELIKGLELRYNRKTKRYDCNLFIPNCNDYGTVETFILKDKENLPLSPNNSKVVNVLLPANYNKDKEYNLLIMADSQNLYDLKKVGKYTKLNDPYGGWQIETSLKALSNKYSSEEYIVAAIETTGEIRMSELTLNDSFGTLRNNVTISKELFKTGKLDKTEQFIMNKLLPTIKEKYKISSKIGIGGSSAGGAFAQYIGIKNNSIFSFILALSPAFTFWSDETIKNFYSDVKLNENKNLPYFFYNIGKKGDLEQMLWDMNKNTISTLKEFGYTDDKIIIYEEPFADHNEIMWRYAFNYAMNEITKRTKKAE